MEKSKNIKNKKKPINSKNKKIKSFKKTLRIIGTIILSMILIGIITGSIVVTAFTVYIMKLMDPSDAIDLDKSQFSYSTFFYAKDKDGNFQPIETLTNGEKRVWVSIEDIPQVVQNAFVYTEDERFSDHDGVDFKRTFSAFANLFLHFYSTEQGASTITQQVVRNVTKDTEVKSDRKIREIFRAMNLEKAYTKTDILEAYLNIIPQGGTVTGIQAASNYYFNKDVSELTITEAACLASIPKDPNKYHPINHPEANKTRRAYVLFQMYDNGVISTEEYETALAEEIKFADKSQTDENGNQVSGVTSYFIDATFEQVVADFMVKYGIDKEAAVKKIKSGGYKIYTTVDLDIQAQLEAKYNDPKTFSDNESIQNALTEKYMNPTAFPNSELEKPPQSSFITMDYNGNVLGVVGGIGQKQESLGFNRATSAVRSPGSCIKPIASYGLAISLDKINWSTKLIDGPLNVLNSKTGEMEVFKVLSPSSGEMEPWPKNYTPGYSYKNTFIYDGLQRSLNTIAAQLVEQITPATSYEFLQNSLHITTLDPQDVDRSPMSVGGMTNGITLQELVASYQVFGNMGKYNKPTYYSKITDANDNIIIQHQYIAQQALDSDSAYVMNRLMKNVVDHGTGTNAKIGVDCELVGKTGTSQDWGDILFVGCTPDYISGVWYGYDTKADTRNTFYSSSALLWNKIFKDIANSGTTKSFEVNPNILQLYFCTETGDIANDTCPKSASVGYYKPSFTPPICSINHTTTP